MTSKMMFLLAMGLGIAASDDAIGPSRAIDPGASDFILPCHFTHAGLYKRHFNIEAYEPGMCTHIYYGKLDLNEKLALMYNHGDLTEGTKKGFYERINNLKLKQPGLKTVMTVGGMMPIDEVNFSHHNFGGLVNDPQARKKEGAKMVQWAKHNHFDGIHINWTPDLMECNKNYTAFLKELKTVGGKDFIVTAALRNSYDRFSYCSHYPNEVAEWGEILDFAHVTTFSYAGPWENRTDFNAPLKSLPAPIAMPNVETDLKSFADLGFPRKKLLLSIPTFAYGWHLLNASKNGVFSPGTPSKPKPYTKSDGYAAYFEICPQKPSHNATEFWSDMSAVPYSVDKQGDWWSHENERSIELKMDMVKQYGFGGAFLYSLDFDDYDGACSGQTFGLTKAVRAGLYKTTTVKPSTTTVATTTDPSLFDFILPCYITHEGLYRKFNGEPFSPEKHYEPGLCTHIIYGFAGLDDNFELLPNKDDLTVGNKTGNYVRINNMKLKQPGLKTVLSIGGMDKVDFNQHNFSKMLNDPRLRKRFISSVLDTVNEYGFDGIDIYWTDGDMKCNPQYTSFLRELKTAAGNLIVTAVLRNCFNRWLRWCPVNNGNYENAEIETWGKILDFAHVSTFNYDCDWRGHLSEKLDNRTYLNAPLLDVLIPSAEGVVEDIRRYVTYRFPKRKLLISIPAFARGWQLKNEKDTDVASPGTPTEPMEYTKKAGFAAYYEICPLRLGNYSKEFWADFDNVPYLVDGNGRWWSYENKTSVEFKMQFVKHDFHNLSAGFGGAIMYSLDLDDYKGVCGPKPFELTRAMRSGLVGVTTTMVPSTTSTTTTNAPATTTTTTSPKSMTSTKEPTTTTTTPKSMTTTTAPTTTTTTTTPKSMTTTKAPTTTTTPPPPPAMTPLPAFKCLEAFGKSSNPHDCRTYYTCWFWQSTLQWCPMYYYWDLRYQQCVWYNSAMCFLKCAPEQHKPEPEWLLLVNV